MTKQEIGEVLKTARLAAGFTQAHVANLLNRKPQVVGHWETGYAQPDANTLLELCDIYGNSIDEAFGKKNNQEALSPEALELARRFDKLDAHGKRVVQAVLDLESEECVHVNRIPVVGVAVQDGSIETKYAARKEVQEISEPTTPTIQEGKQPARQR